MKIRKSLSKIINIDDKEVKYIYRVIESKLKGVQAFGIEVERQDLNNGQVINLERDSVNIVATKEKNANEILMLLFNNIVSPIHLVDIVGEYSDLCVNDFSF